LIPRTPAGVGKFYNCRSAKSRMVVRADERMRAPMTVVGNELPTSSVRFDGE